MSTALSQVTMSTAALQVSQLALNHSSRFMAVSRQESVVDGSGEGVGDGIAVGPGVGGRVGSGDGVRVGRAVGSGDGTGLGDGDGTGVGAGDVVVRIRRRSEASCMASHSS